jgi:hypothetical protein
MVIAEFVGNLAPASSTAHKARSAQDTEVLGDQGLRRPQRVDELVHASFSVVELFQDAQPQRRGKHLEQFCGGLEIIGRGARHRQKLTDAYLCMQSPGLAQRRQPGVLDAHAFDIHVHLAGE